jgi:hypothetical protein
MVAFTLTLCITGDALGQWPEYTQIAQKNYIEIGGRAFNRPGADLDFPVLIDGTTNETLFDVNAATSASSAAGVELQYHFQNRNGGQMEFRTFLGNWDTNNFFEGGNIESPVFPGQVFDTVDYTYQSEIFSFELMSKRSLGQGLTIFAGPRFVSLRDEISTEGAEIFNPPTIVIPRTSRQDFLAINNFIGLQAGLRFDKQLSQYFRAAGFIRAGGYFNPTTVRTSLESFVVEVAPDVTLDTEATKSTGSFIGEVGGKLYVDLAPGCSLYGGYEGTWIDGIALAPSSFLTVETNEIETANTLFMHAITFGMQFAW